MVVALIGDLNDGTSGKVIKAPDSGYCKNQLYSEHSDSHTVWLPLLPWAIHAEDNAACLHFGIQKNCPKWFSYSFGYTSTDFHSDIAVTFVYHQHICQILCQSCED